MTTIGPVARPKGAGDRPIEIDGVGYHAISDVDRMWPFVMSVLSHGDRGIYVSNTGGITPDEWTARHRPTVAHILSFRRMARHDRCPEEGPR